MSQAESPKDFLKKIGKVWERYYDRGIASIEFVGDNKAISRVIDCQGLPLHHEILILPYMVRLLTLVGANNVVAKHTKCVAKRHTSCVYEYTWDKP